MNIYEKHNFKSDNDMSEFNQIFSNNKVDVHIDTYIDKPYIMIARIIENGVSPLIENGRFILRKKDRNKTVLVNLPLEDIEDCATKMYAESHYQVLFKVCNVCYKMLVILKR